MITEIKLAGKIPGGTAGRALQITVTAAAVLSGLVFRIFTDAVFIITTADPVFFIVCVDDIAGTVIEKSHALFAAFKVQCFLKILQFFLMYGAGDRKVSEAV